MKSSTKELPRMTKRKLILHFDVNKTIIMKDASLQLTTVKYSVIIKWLTLGTDKLDCVKSCMGKNGQEKWKRIWLEISSW